VSCAVVEGLYRCWVREEEEGVRGIGMQLLNDVEEEDSEKEKNV
jgi:hypothetical protein